MPRMRGQAFQGLFSLGLVERLGVNRELSVGLADGDAPGVRGAHHDAFQYGLSADEGFLGALQGKRKLKGGVKAQVGAERHLVLHDRCGISRREAERIIRLVTLDA